MYVYIYMYIYIYIYIYICVYIYIYMYMCIYICVCVCLCNVNITPIYTNNDMCFVILINFGQTHIMLIHRCHDGHGAYLDIGKIGEA